MEILTKIVNQLSWRRDACAVFLLVAATVIPLHAQTFTTLVNFDEKNGVAQVMGAPGVGIIGLGTAPLVWGADGNLYGTTPSGGTQGGGTVFQMTPAGTLTTLHSFDAFTPGRVPPDGAAPVGGLVQATDGSFYGTTSEGGGGGLLLGGSTIPGIPTLPSGTVFKITAGGALTTFCTFIDAFTGNPNGITPITTLVQATDGNFYGTTLAGGSNGPLGGGTVFQITAGGALTTLYSFAPNDSTYWAGLVQATDGNLYGTTLGGGVYLSGTVFQITTGGTLTTIYSFQGTADGGGPHASLIQAADGNLYGTTCCTVFKISL